MIKMLNFQGVPVWHEVLKLCRRLHDEGFTAWLAGGCVRDALLGLPAKDFDVATDASMDELKVLFPNSIEVGAAFGVLKVKTLNKSTIDVACFRSDGAYIDGRHPAKVQAAPPQQDAQRRDFTVNALFYDPVTDQIHDFVGGLNDLNQKILKAVGEPKLRFEEDKLRMLRAARFVAQLDFVLDASTQAAIKAQASEIKVVSRERITAELRRLFNTRNTWGGVKVLLETNLLESCFPGAHFSTKVIEKSFRHSLFKKPHHPLLGFALVVCAASAGDVLAGFRLSRQESDDIEKASQWMSIIKGFSKLRPSAQKKLAWDPRQAVDLGCELVTVLGKKVPSDLDKLRQEQQKLPPPFLKGEDLLNLGLSGVTVGELLAELYDLQLDDKIKSRDEAIAWAKKRCRGTI